MIDSIMNSQLVEALGWTLLHSLWQGTAIALLLVIVLIALRKYSAQSRYIVSVGLFSSFFLILSVTFWSQWQHATHHNDKVALEINNQQEEILTSNIALDKPINPENQTTFTTQINKEILSTSQSNWIIKFKDYFDRHLPLLVLIWLIGVLFLQLRFLGQLVYVQRIKHYGVQLIPASWSDKIEELEGKLRIQKKVGYLTSIKIESPMTIGWLKPVVLIPQQLFHSLSETEIYAVLAHELAHIRREDFMVNLLQTFLCNFLFFHPGVWWMSNRIDDEREHCCDDLAVAATGPATSYAKTLINVSEYQLRTQQSQQLAMAFTGKNKKRERGGFSTRVKRLFKVHNGGGSFREGFATALILLSTIFVGVIAASSTSQDIESPTLAKNEKTEKPIVHEDSINTILDPNLSTSSPAKNADTGREKPPIQTQVENPIRSEDQGFTTASAIPSNQSYDTRIDALVMACAEGDLEFVTILVNSGINVNHIGSEGFTPLMMATSNDEPEIVEYLIKQGADVNQSYNGWNALIESADEGSLACMKLLLSAGADVNYYGRPESPTAISMAASEGHLECLKLLVKNGADINGIGSSVPPLHNAAEEGKINIIDYLFSQKVDLDKKDAAGRTALMYAASEGKGSVVDLLISNNAKLNIMDHEGRTALMYAAAEGKRSVVKKLISHKANLDIKDMEGRTALIYAELEGKRSVIEDLVEAGVEHTLIDQRDIKAIEYFEKEVENESHFDSEHENSSHGNHSFHYDFDEEYDRNSRRSFDNEKSTSIHQATLNGLMEKVQYMVEQGADVNERDPKGRTPLHLASKMGYTNDMRTLFNLGADINAQDKNGRTPLMYAAAEGIEDAVALLVSKKALVNIQDKGGLRAYEYATKSRNSDLADFLGLITEHKTSSFINNEKSGQNARKKSDAKSKDKSNQKEAQQRESFHINGNSTHLRQFELEENTKDLFEILRDGSIEECTRLLDMGIDPNTADATGQTPLMMTVMANRPNIAKLLIERGADVNMSSASGLTALHYTALGGDEEMARFLLQNGAKVDAPMRYSSTDGNFSNEPLVWEYLDATPLFIAVENGNSSLISVLIEAGANKNYSLIRNEYKLNENRAIFLSASEVMGLDEEFLKEAKLQTNDTNWTPYKQAVLLDNSEILVLFRN